jgi:ABC-2 type transport system permease protein
MRLYLAELTRLRSRRAVVLLLVACLLATVVIFAGTAWSTRPVSDAELQQAQEQVDRELAQPYMKRQIARCERNPDRYGARDSAACAASVGPRVEWFLGRPQLRMGEALRSSGLGLITVLMGLLMLAGTTFAGADWNSGSMSNQLLFEPRRTRVWFAKAAAVVTAAVVTSAVMLGAFWAAMAWLAASRDITTLPEVADMVWGSSWRATLLIGAAALGAYAVTMLVRSTVFTLGAMFAVVVGATIVMAMLGISEAWFPNKNLGAVIWDGTRYYAYPPDICFAGPRPPEGVDCREFATLTAWQGVRNLGVLLVGAVAASAWSFRRRDVP